MICDILNREDLILKLEELKQEVKTYESSCSWWINGHVLGDTGPAIRFYRQRPSLWLR